MIRSRRDINLSEAGGHCCADCKRLKEKQEHTYSGTEYRSYVCGVDGFVFGPLSGLNRIICDKWIQDPRFIGFMTEEEGTIPVYSEMDAVADDILAENPPQEPEIIDVSEDELMAIDDECEACKIQSPIPGVPVDENGTITL